MLLYNSTYINGALEGMENTEPAFLLIKILEFTNESYREIWR